MPESQGEIALSFAPVVREASPAVVNIYARRMVQGRRNSPFDNDPFFGPLFRDLAPTQPQIQNSLGSGVILSPDGLVVSNYHVVGEASEIRVVLNDRREYEADILLGDEETDLAVLRLRGARDLPSLTLRDTDNVEVGELVLAIGNPLGELYGSVTVGVVSGLNRSRVLDGVRHDDIIQTDAAINSGNSGGALVNLAGQFVGMPTTILRQSNGGQTVEGVAFAIPSRAAHSALEVGIQIFLSGGQRPPDRNERLHDGTLSFAGKPILVEFGRWTAMDNAPKPDG